jgi:hypothetical protein
MLKVPIGLNLSRRHLLTWPLLLFLFACGHNPDKQTGVVIETTTLEATIPAWENIASRRMNIYLLDTSGNILDSVQSDQNGNFQFKVNKENSYGLLILSGELGLHLNRPDDLTLGILPGPLMDLHFPAVDSLVDFSYLQLFGGEGELRLLERNLSYIYSRVYPGTYSLNLKDSKGDGLNYSLRLWTLSAELLAMESAPTVREPVIRPLNCGVTLATEFALRDLCWYAEDDRYDKQGNSRARLLRISDSLVQASLQVDETAPNEKQYSKLNALFHSDEHPLNLNGLDSLQIDFRWSGGDSLMIQLLSDNNGEDWIRHSILSKSTSGFTSIALKDFIDKDGNFADSSALSSVYGLGFRTETPGNSGIVQILDLKIK